jgi:hypothetical protein
MMRKINIRYVIYQYPDMRFFEDIHVSVTANHVGRFKRIWMRYSAQRVPHSPATRTRRVQALHAGVDR